MLFFLTGQMTKCPAKVLSFLRPLLYSRQWSNSFSFTGNLNLLLTQITKYQGSCKFSGANIWNTLPLALRSQHDLNKFGFDLKRRFMHQSIPPAPSPHTPSHLPSLSVPGMGHLQIFHCPGARNLPTPGPFLSFWHAHDFLSEYNYTDGFTGKKQIGSSVKDRNKLKRVIKACSQFYAYISSLLIKIT